MKKNEILFGVIVALFLAIAVSPFASPWPDGLEKVAEDKGFLEKGEVAPILVSPVPDYVWPGIKSERIATSLAGAAGTLVSFTAGVILAVIIKRGRSY